MHSLISILVYVLVRLFAEFFFLRSFFCFITSFHSLIIIVYRYERYSQAYVIRLDMTCLQRNDAQVLLLSIALSLFPSRFLVLIRFSCLFRFIRKWFFFVLSLVVAIYSLKCTLVLLLLHTYNISSSACLFRSQLYRCTNNLLFAVHFWTKRRNQARKKKKEKMNFVNFFLLLFFLQLFWTLFSNSLVSEST